MTLLGVAFLIHFIIMSTFAEREGKVSIYLYCSIYAFPIPRHAAILFISQNSYETLQLAK